MKDRVSRVYLAEGSSLVEFDPRLTADRRFSSLLVDITGTQGPARAHLCRYLEVLELLVPSLKIAVVVGSGGFGDLRGRGWIVEHAARWWGEPVEPDFLAQRAHHLGAQAVLVAGSGPFLTRTEHYQVCSLLGVRLRWSAIAPALSAV